MRVENIFMANIGKVYSEYQKGNAEAWYRIDEVNPENHAGRRILTSDGEECSWGRDSGHAFWREIGPLPDVRSDAERERDELRVERDELRDVIGKIANEVGNPEAGARIRGILLDSMGLLPTEIV